MIPVAIATAHPAPGHVPPAAKKLHPFARLPADTQMHLAIGLPLRDGQAMTNLMQQIYDPPSPHYHQFLTPEEFTARFGPTPADYRAVTEFARSNHLRITATHADRMLVDIDGVASDVEKAFHIRLLQYHHPHEPRDFFAPETEPAIAPEIPILDISGLNNYGLPHSMIRHETTSRIDGASKRATGSGTNGTYFGGDFRAAYLLDVALTGTGQTVGLVEFDGFYPVDITNYENQAGIAPVLITTNLIDSFDGRAGSGNDEVALDIEMLIAIAPGLSNIVLFEAPPNDTSGPNAILSAMAANTQILQFGCSWGWIGGPTATTDQYFQKMILQGQSFFCASGDADAYAPGSVDNASLPNAPSDNPYITIVGGTTLTTSGPGGSWVAETVWNLGGGTGSGGGISSYYPIPSWQQGFATIANGGSSAWRNFPDVALVADNIFIDYNNGHSEKIGGTSAAAPLWAGITALANQKATSAGLPPIGFINPAIYNIASKGNYSSDFHDITSGNNTSSSSPGLFYAEPGFDLCTGLGTPIGLALINDLTTPADPLVVTPASPVNLVILAGGPIGPNSQTYSLTNFGSAQLSWTLGSDSPWLTASITNGTLQSGGPAMQVTVQLNNSANALPAGKYIGNIFFTNLNTGYVQARQFSLQVLSQLVQNGGFETADFSGWIQTGGTTYTSVTTSSFYVHSGAEGAQMGPSGTRSYIGQTIPTVPGQSYVLSFWLTNPKAGNTNEFLASWNSTTLLDAQNIPQLPWTNYQFIVTATNTTSTLQFGFRNDPGYFGFDDVNVAPIASLLVQSFVKNNTSAQFTFNTISGLRYQVQYETNLAQTNWLNLAPSFTATNTTTTVTDPSAGDPARYYRVQLLP